MVQATLDGTPIEFEADGLLARAIQHELDHTRGILFIDRATEESRAEFDEETRRLSRPTQKI
jgi:peptide deformylase